MADNVASEQKKEDWMNSKWRPMMGWMYMLICTMDMVIFPVLWSLLQAFTHTAITQWNPLTLQGAGLFHIAMGAVLGIAAFGRTQEKLNGANNGGAQTPTTGFASGPATPSVPSAGFGAPTGGFGSPTTAPTPTGFGGGGFGSTPSPAPASGGFGGGSGFGASATQPITTGFGGKKVVPEEPQPVL
jgi:Holin of 3TMs, for gene-transfer release